jgi:uncharacterized protein YbjT (DUF2867 family)
LIMKILLTGATGYVGGELLRVLRQAPDVQLRLFVRDAKRMRDNGFSALELVQGNTLDKNSLRRGLEGADVAYYLVHSMGSGADFERLDRLSAWNFLEAAIEKHVPRIIYLGGLGNAATASRHLLSRIETGEILSARPELVQTLWFRAAIIIGAGSAGFEIIRHLVRKLPVMITPRWVGTLTQPISIADVVQYLALARSVDVSGNLVVDIGSERLTFRDMLETTAAAMNRRLVLVPVPLLTPRLSSWWLVLLTPIPFSVARALVDGLKSETVITNANARKFFVQVRPLSFEESVRRALAG